MRKLREFSALVAEFSHAVDFLTIYIQEAHPAELWPNPQQSLALSISSHGSLQDRLSAAATLANAGIPGNVLADGMENMASQFFGAQPVRLCVIQDGVVTFLGGMGPIMYCPHEVGKFLRDQLNC
ncbi:hypothetical protein BaRGS_00011072 [Batillaria attramentaria]|uniref:Iodothyronine deiodinase n=1 Tax=Batillaria attramentaria TaxID=370345 RepID=A0ABD0LED5_9CAEN